MYLTNEASLYWCDMPQKSQTLTDFTGDEVYRCSASLDHSNLKGVEGGFGAYFDDSITIFLGSSSSDWSCFSSSSTSSLGSSFFGFLLAGLAAGTSSPLPELARALLALDLGFAGAGAGAGAAA